MPESDMFGKESVPAGMSEADVEASRKKLFGEQGLVRDRGLVGNEVVLLPGEEGVVDGEFTEIPTGGDGEAKENKTLPKWERTLNLANTPGIKGRDALLRAAKKQAEKALEDSDDDVTEMTRIAESISKIDEELVPPDPVGAAPISQSPRGGASIPGAARPEAGSGNREMVRVGGELAMKLRGHIIAAIINGNVDENALNSGVTKFVADRVLKRADLIVINEDDRKQIEEEIKARIELQKVSNYWIGLKGEPIPLKKMKETITQAVALSPESERWLERPNHDCSYIDEVTGETVEVRDLVGDINLAAKKLLAKMGKPKSDPDSVNLQTMFVSRDYVAEARKLTGKSNIGVITLQLAEAGIWAAEIEIPDEGFRHPAADIVKYARMRFLAASKGKPALNGHRLIQEYQERNRGGIPGDESVFAPEGVSLGRTELDLFGGAREAIEAGRYLTTKKENRRGDGLSYSEEVRDDLVAACQFLTSLNDLTGAESALDPNSLVGKFFVIKIGLGKVATRFMPAIYAGGVDTNETARKAWISRVMTETVKTGVWANSLLNKWNSKSVLSLPDLYEAARLAIVAMTDNGEPLYIGSALPARETLEANIEFVKWFGRLWDKYIPIVLHRRNEQMIGRLPAYFQRDAIPSNISASSSGIFDANEWVRLLQRGLVNFKQKSKTKEKLMGTEKK